MLRLNKASVLGRKLLHCTTQFFRKFIPLFYVRITKNKHYQESL